MIKIKKVVLLIVVCALLISISATVLASNYDILYRNNYQYNNSLFNELESFLNFLSDKGEIKDFKANAVLAVALLNNQQVYFKTFSSSPHRTNLNVVAGDSVNDFTKVTNKIGKLNGKYKKIHASSDDYSATAFAAINLDDYFEVYGRNEYRSNFASQSANYDHIKVKDIIVIENRKPAVAIIDQNGNIHTWGYTRNNTFNSNIPSVNFKKFIDTGTEGQIAALDINDKLYVWGRDTKLGYVYRNRPSWGVLNIKDVGLSKAWWGQPSIAIDQNGTIKYTWGASSGSYYGYNYYHNIPNHIRSFLSNTSFDKVDIMNQYILFKHQNEKRGTIIYPPSKNRYDYTDKKLTMKNINLEQYSSYFVTNLGFVGIKSSAPQVQTSSITFSEGEQSSHLIKAGGGEGELTYSTSGVPSGMTFKKVSNGYEVKWKPEYDINKNKFSSKVTRNFDLTVTDSKGEGVSKNITVYINNQPKPIDNIDNYKAISDLPVKPVDTELEKPELPVFDKDSNLADKNMFTDITNYTFVEVEEKAPYPGDEPNMIAKIKTSLVEGSNQDIHNSLSNGNVEGYKDFTNELVKYNQARDAYKNLEDLVEKQYDEQDNDELFFNNLKELIKYNNENNYLGEEIDLADYKDYDNMKALYDLLKNKLQTRQGKLDENIKQYNKYVKAVEEYNSLLENRLGLLIDNYKTDYIPKYESWKTDKENYLNNLQSKVQEYNLYNENLYNQKVEEIAGNIDQYGLVSLKVNDINQPPNLDAHYLSEVNKFDLNTIDNIYGSIKDYPYLNEEIKNSIKNKFNDGVYNEEKFDWLKNTVKTNLDVSIKNSTDVNEKYLIE